MADCRWIVREGRGVKYFAYTTCEKGYNPLTRVNTVQGIKEFYENRMCPICKGTIKIDLTLIEEAEE